MHTPYIDGASPSMLYDNEELNDDECFFI
jgi:hypothetical protein